MKFHTSMSSFCIVTAATLFAGQSSEAPTASASGDGPNVFDGTLLDGDAVPEISTADLVKALKDASVVLLDARPPEEFAKSHIPGALAVRGLPGLSPSKYTADASEVRRLVPQLARRLVVYCNGLYCGRSKRFAADLRQLGYANLKRYQLGIPAWRALGGVTQVEKEALLALLAADSTAVLIDARNAKDATPRLARARWVPPAEAAKAKDDGRLPMTDHNTRILVVADGSAQARTAAEAIVHDAFHNVSFYAGRLTELTSLHAEGK